VIGLRVLLLVIVGTTCIATGCKKSGDSGGDNNSAAKDATVLIVPNDDVKPDGTITEPGLGRIQAKSETPNLTLVFVRSPLNDSGLNQLAKFTKIHRVEAYGSRITDKGITKLQQSIPNLEVVK